MRKYKSMILEDLESALAEHAPAPQEVNSELPPLTIDGIPVSVDKMTQVSGRGNGNLEAATEFCRLCSDPVGFGSAGSVCPEGGFASASPARPEGPWLDTELYHALFPA